MREFYFITITFIFNVFKYRIAVEIIVRSAQCELSISPLENACTFIKLSAFLPSGFEIRIKNVAVHAIIVLAMVAPRFQLKTFWHWAPRVRWPD